MSEWKKSHRHGYRKPGMLVGMTNGKLILLRHGQSQWNESNQFTGWVDVDLTAKGEAEAKHGGELLKEQGILPDVLYTSLLRRAIRTANIALLHYADGEKRYIIAPKGLKQGTIVEAGANADIKVGNNLPLRNIPTGTTIHAVELKPGAGAKLARSAGASIQLLGKEGKYAILRMPSSEIRRVDIRCRATVGEVGNADQMNIRWGKAGRMRWKGVRPTVRGVVMNPVDHPHGGGEGKTSGGRHPVSPWGKKEGRTRNPNRYSNNMIVRRRRPNKKR